MANTIKLKSGSGNNPSASDLVVGEVALRTDGNPKLFTKNDAGNVLEVGLVESGSIVAGSIVNVDINASAAIAGTKISPDFGSQAVSTTNNLSSSDITITGAAPKITFTDSDNNPDFLIQNSNGAFVIHDATNATTRLVINSDGHIDLKSNVDCEAGLDVTGSINATTDITLASTTAGQSIFVKKDGTESVKIGHIGTGNEGFIALKDGGTDTVVLHGDAPNGVSYFNAGNVAIGKTTASEKLDVVGNIAVSGTVDGKDISALGITGTTLSDGVTATTQSASDNSTKVATTAYTDTAISNLVDSSPSTLNTLNELAAALGDDANFSTTVTNSIATKMPLAGGAFTGNVVISHTNPQLTLNDSNSENDFAIKNNNGNFQIIDLDESNRIGFQFGSDGNTFLGGNVSVGGTVDGRDVAADGTKLDGIEANAINASNTAITNKLPLAGGTLTGNLTISNTEPTLFLTDTNNNSDFKIRVQNGVLLIEDTTNNNADRFQIGSNGTVDIFGNLDVGAGIDVTGVITGTSHIDLPDDARLKLGNSDDFEIFHQASNSNSIIKETGGGILSLQTNGSEITFFDIANNTIMAQFNTGGSCLFKHGADIRLQTTSTGINVTGTLNVAGVIDSTVAGADNMFTLETTSSGDPSIFFNAAGSGGHRIQYLRSSNTLNFTNGSSNRLQITAAGHTIPGTDSLYDLGLTGTRWRNVYADTYYGDGSNLTGLTVNNANTLDNLDSTQFLRSDANDTYTGTLTLSSATLGASQSIFLNGATNFDNLKNSGFYSLYNVNASGHTNAPFQFGAMITAGNTYEGGGMAMQIAHERLGNGTFIRGMNDTGDTWYSWQEIWTSGVDGSGSGLDADTLDGIQASSFLRSDAEDTSNSRLNFTNASSYPVIIGSASGMDDGRLLLRGSNNPYIRFREQNTDKAYIQWNSSGWLQLSNEETGESLKIVNGSNGLKWTIGSTDYIVWNQSNDGSGTGLDSDTVDGIHASSFLRSDTNDTINGVLTVGGTSVSSGEGGEIQLTQAPNGSLSGSTVNIDVNGNNLRFFEDTGNNRGFYLDIGSASNSATGKIFHNTNDGSGSGLDADNLDGRTWSESASTSTIVSRNGSGYIFGSYLNMTGTFSNSGNGSGMSTFTGTNGSDTYGRSFTAAAARTLLNVENGATADQTASEILNLINGVDGSGSGLDSDTVDGLQASNFVRSDTSDTMNGELTMSVGQDRQVILNRNISSPANYYNGLQMEVRATSGTAGIGLHRAGYSHVGIYHDGSGTVKFDMNNGTATLSGAAGSIWGSNGDGSGTGLDADTVDGIQGASFLRSDANDTLGGVLSYTSNDARLQFTNSSYGQSLHIGGWTSANNSGISRIRNSNDNLHIDCGANGGLYLNFYSQTLIYASTIIPRTNNTFDLGSSSNRWRDLYINDLNLSNEGSSNDVDGTWGSYTIQEGAEELYLINKRNGKKYKFNLTEVS